MTEKMISTIQTWKIDVGTHAYGKAIRKDLVANRIVFAGTWAPSILGERSFQMSPEKRKVLLVCCSVADLGCDSKTSLAEIYATAEEKFGFGLCNCEEGFQLRRQYDQQPPGEVIHIAMEQISGPKGGKGILRLKSAPGKLSIGCIGAQAESIWNKGKRFVFVANNAKVQKLIRSIEQNGTKVRLLEFKSAKKKVVGKRDPGVFRSDNAKYAGASQLEIFSRRIRRLDMFAGVTEEEILDIFQYCRIKRLNRNDIIFAEGEKCENVHFIIDGSVYATTDNHESDYCHFLHVYSKGESLTAMTEGEMAQCNAVVRQNDTHLLIMTRKNMEYILCKYPRIAQRYRDDITNTINRLISKTKFSRMLAKECVSFQVKALSIHVMDNRFLRCGKMSHGEIAKLIGIKRETVTRARARMPMEKTMLRGIAVPAGSL